MYEKNDSRSGQIAEGEGVGGLEEGRMGRTCLGEMDVEVTCDTLPGYAIYLDMQS